MNKLNEEKWKCWNSNMATFFPLRIIFAFIRGFAITVGKSILIFWNDLSFQKFLIKNCNSEAFYYAANT